MISNPIDGSGGGGAAQLLDLLALVSNPAVYEAKIKALQAAIDENKKFVELVAPASEILKLREEAKADREAATTALADAKDRAADAVATAQSEKAAVLAAAKDEANAIVGRAKAMEAAVAVKQAKADEAAKVAADAEAAAAKKLEAAQAREDAAKQAKADADAAKAAADAYRNELIIKHEAFIQSL